MGQGPRPGLFNRLKEIFGELPFIAEDLGLITKEVDELREFFGMPGMRILQFGFGDRGAHLYLPHRFVENTVVYTGTHDNNTTLGWWRDDANEAERANVADLPAQDQLRRRHRLDHGQGRRCFGRQDLRLPAAGHPAPRLGGPHEHALAPSRQLDLALRPAALHPDFASKLAAIMEMTDRDGYQKPVEGPAAGGPTTKPTSAWWKAPPSKPRPFVCQCLVFYLSLRCLLFVIPEGNLRLHLPLPVLPLAWSPRTSHLYRTVAFLREPRYLRARCVKALAVACFSFFTTRVK